MNEKQTGWQVEVFFDGDCPLCKREIALLERMDRKNHVRFTDIAAPSFFPAELGVSMSDLMDRIHGRLPDGQWIEGVDVFRHLYAAIGLGWLVPISRLPGIHWLLDWAYRLFARNRLRWTGRCNDTCTIPSRPSRPNSRVDPTS